MRALCRNHSGGIEVLDLQEPKLKKPDDVKIRVRYATICSDETGMDQEGDFFSREGVLGHEMCGEVVELGEAAKNQGFRIGDKVSGDGALSCGQCIQCKRRQENYCMSLKFINGCMCKYIIRSSRQLVKLSPDVSFREGSLLEPVASVLQGAEKANISMGKSVAIFGAGFCGLMFVQIAKMRGASNVTVIEPIEYRRKLAIERGADYAIDVNEEELGTRLSTLTNFNGYDIVIETSSDIMTIDFAVQALSRGGTLLFFTYYGVQEKFSINTMNMYADNLTICFSFSSHGKMEEAARMFPLLKVEELIGKEFSLEDGWKAYQYQKTKNSIKVGIKIS